MSSLYYYLYFHICVIVPKIKKKKNLKFKIEKNTDKHTQIKIIQEVTCVGVEERENLSLLTLCFDTFRKKLKFKNKDKTIPGFLNEH